MATFIACLGQSLCPDGSVPATLAARCAQAAELHRRFGAPVVLSGADVSGVGVSEAQAREPKWNTFSNALSA